MCIRDRYYSDGTRSIDLSKDDLELVEGDNKVYLSPMDFGLEYAGGNGVNHLLIKKADQSLDFKYEDQLATFDNANGLVLNSSGKLLTYKDKELYV